MTDSTSVLVSRNKIQQWYGYFRRHNDNIVSPIDFYKVRQKLSGKFEVIMLSEKSYRTVEKEAESEYKEKKSVFLGYCKSVRTEEEAIRFIEKIKSKHRDARHNVYAYCLREGHTKRYSDDGEPQGTAGTPILDIILKNELTDIVIVVTRYFGGILLGTGGLVRAYSTSAKQAIEQAEIITMTPCTAFTLQCDYNQYGKISSFIPQAGGIIDNSVFGAEISMEFHLPTGSKETFCKKLADITSGSIVPKEEFCDFYAIK